MGLSFDIVMGFQCSSGNAHLLNSVYPVIGKIFTREQNVHYSAGKIGQLGQLVIGAADHG